MTELFDRRGPMVCVQVGSYGERWEPWAAVLGRSMYFRFPNAGHLTLAEVEAALMSA